MVVNACRCGSESPQNRLEAVPIRDTEIGALGVAESEHAYVFCTRNDLQ